MDHRILLSQFEALGLFDDSLVTSAQIHDTMNRLLRKNTRQPTVVFSDDIAEEVWDQCLKVNDGRTAVRDYIDVLIQASSILEGRVRETQEKLHSLRAQREYLQKEMIKCRPQTTQAELQRLRAQIQENAFQIISIEKDNQYFQADYKAITNAFSQGPTLSRHKPSISQSLVVPGYFINVGIEHSSVAKQSTRMHSQIFMKRSSLALTLILYLGLLLFFLELFVMMHKYHFLTLLSSIAVLSIFLLNYFDKKYISLTLGILAASLLLDLFWIVGGMTSFVNPGKFSAHSTIYVTMLRVTSLTVVVNMAIKTVIFLTLMGYREVQESSSVTIFGRQVWLCGECKPLRSWEVNY